MKRGFLKLAIIFLILTFMAYFFLYAETGLKDLDLQRLSGFINNKINQWKVPGLAIAIVKDGKVIFSKGFGYRDVKQKLKVTEKTLFPIGSTTKAFTATAAGILVDDGELEWDKPIKEYLPFFKLKDAFASEEITLRDFLCHRSGLPRHDAVWINSPATRRQLVERLQYLEPGAGFRTTFQYQNLMYMAAGYLLGQITGSTWEEFVQKRIFSSLGMKDSNFSINDLKKSPDFALPYAVSGGQFVEIPFRDYGLIGPAGSINSNVTDMAKWIMLNLNNGKYEARRIISQESLREVHSPQMVIGGPIKYDEFFHTSYGMGWFITAYRGRLILWHGGGAEGFTASVSLMPGKGIGMVILANMHKTRLNSIIGYYVYDRMLGLEPVLWEERIKDEIEKSRGKTKKVNKSGKTGSRTKTVLSRAIEDYGGDYENPGYGIVSIKKQGEGLILTYNSFSSVLEHYYDDIFVIKSFGLRISFFTDKQGQIVSLSIPLEPKVKDIMFTRK